MRLLKRPEYGSTRIANCFHFIYIDRFHEMIIWRRWSNLRIMTFCVHFLLYTARWISLLLYDLPLYMHCTGSKFYLLDGDLGIGSIQGHASCIIMARIRTVNRRSIRVK